MTWKSHFVPVALALTNLSACTYLNYDVPNLPDPPASKDNGVVVLFAGWTPPGTTVDGTGMFGVTQELRSIGVNADVYAPSEWEDAAAEIERLPSASQTPIAVIGYSLGAAGAAKLAEALASKGIPVQTLVAIEPWHAPPVPCNVRDAVDIYDSDSPFSLSGRLDPGPGFDGTLQQINYSKLSQDGASLNHWTISMVEGVHRLVRNEVLDGNHVRRRPMPAGEAACIRTAMAVARQP